MPRDADGAAAEGDLVGGLEHGDRNAALRQAEGDAHADRAGSDDHDGQGRRRWHRVEAKSVAVVLLWLKVGATWSRRLSAVGRAVFAMLGFRGSSRMQTRLTTAMNTK